MSKIYSCFVFVETHRFNEFKLDEGEIIKVELRSEKSVSEVVSRAIGFSLKPYGNTFIGWANDLQDGEQEIIVSADSICHASLRARLAYKAYRSQIEKTEARKYEDIISSDAENYSLQVWKEMVARGDLTSHDGVGYWCKDGKESFDEVFETPPEDATHVAWYNK